MSLKDKAIPVLDHGYVKFVQSCGTDETIIRAARQSTSGSFVSWDPYEGHPNGDMGLLDYCYRKTHAGPFEMCDLTVEVQAPIVTIRQWFRHRTASYNEMSGRYTEMPEIHYLPAPERFTQQGAHNKQGSSAEAIDPALTHDFHVSMATQQRAIAADYERMLKAGVAKEVARLNTPISAYSRFWAKANLRNWFHFLWLRMASDAQYEIRVFANALAAIVREEWPRSWALFEEYDLYASKMSRTELRVLKKLAASNNIEVLAKEMGMKGSHLREFLQKLAA